MNPTTVSACCGAEIEMKHRVYIGDGWEYCSKCKKLLKYLTKEEVEKWTTPTHSPTETEKRIWGSVCCNVGTMLRGIGRDQYHICNKCRKRCYVRYDESPIEPTVDKWERDLIKLFDGNDGTTFSTWLMCYNGELDSDPPFDCACCLARTRNGLDGCGCICHTRFKILIDFIRTLLSHSVQEAKAEERERIENLVTNYEDVLVEKLKKDPMSKGRERYFAEEIIGNIDGFFEWLASLKQEEGK